MMIMTMMVVVKSNNWFLVQPLHLSDREPSTELMSSDERHAPAPLLLLSQGQSDIFLYTPDYSIKHKVLQWFLEYE